MNKNTAKMPDLAWKVVNADFMSQQASGSRRLTYNEGATVDAIPGSVGITLYGDKRVALAMAGEQYPVIEVEVVENAPTPEWISFGCECGHLEMFDQLRKADAKMELNMLGGTCLCVHPSSGTRFAKSVKVVGVVG
jgi:hypothetical protein